MLPHQPGREVQAAGAYFWWFWFPHQVPPVREQSCPGARHGWKKFRSDLVPVPHVSVKYPMWYHDCFLRKPLFQTPLPLCWVVLSDSYHHTACLSLPGQLVNAVCFPPKKQKCTPPACSSGNPQHFMSPLGSWETSSGLIRLHGWVLTQTRQSQPLQPFTFSKTKAKPQPCDCS